MEEWGWGREWLKSWKTGEGCPPYSSGSQSSESKGAGRVCWGGRAGAASCSPRLSNSDFGLQVRESLTGNRVTSWTGAR